MWPKGFRKKKPYTGEELSNGCERAAERIKKAIGGEIIHIAPPDEKRMRLGPVHPPGGGTINWKYHRAVRIGDRIYDLMTGEGGMALDDYKLLFDYWDAFVITTIEE
jgi:hypothetical protein